MNLRTVRTIFKKEMLDTVRDKRTLIMMIGVPVLLYPTLVIVGMQGALVQIASLDRSVSKVAIQSPEPEAVRAWLEDIEKIEIVDSDNPAGALRDGGLQAVVRVDGPVVAALAEGRTVQVEILYDSTEYESSGAATRLREGLEKDRDALLESRLADLQIEMDYIHPLRLERKDTAPPAKATGNALGIVLPVLMVVMLALGAFYPAVDVTAGEKERGTFETLLSTPTTKLEIVAGKFGTVFLLAMATGLLNLGSMAATFAFVAGQLRPVLGDAIQFDLQFPPSAAAVFLIIMVPLAFFVSAVMMAVAVFARSFKEAQNYVTPFFLVLMVPVFFSSMPGVKLNAATQFLPVANVILLFRDMLTGKAEFEMMFAVFLSTVAFAALALLFAAWLFQREEVILSEEKGFPLTWRRSEFRPRDTITAGMSIALFVIMLIMLFYVGSTVQTWSLLPGLLITEWLLILAPILLLLWYTRVNFRSALNLHPISPTGAAASLVTGFFAVILVIQLGYWFNRVLPVPQEFQEEMAKLFGGAGGLPQLAALLFVAAVSPAICEEVMFRGVMLSGFRSRMGNWPAIVLSGVLFGIFHISVYRIPPIAVLGIVLSYLTVRTGSIHAGILVHLLNNTLAILLATGYAPEFVSRVLQLDEFESQGLPMPVLLVAVAGFAAGVVGVEASARRSPAKPMDA